jgi:hypothetical protein
MTSISRWCARTTGSEAARLLPFGGLVELPPRLKPGDPVRVTRGLLEGLTGLYAGQSPQQRVLVLLALLGTARQVELPAADVAAAW